MIIGLGIDIVDLTEFRDRLNDDLVAELFLPAEMEYCRSQAHSWENYAGRFAAKEAAFKALGAGLEQGLRFNQVEILRADTGAVSLEFHGRAAELAAELGVLKSFVSISHSRSNAVAVVIAEGESQ
jgi:holo-[acyl-carrier protein] synthase